MDNFLKMLIGCTLSMAAVTLLAAAVSPLIEKRYSRRALYGLWLVVLLGFLIPFRPQASEQRSVVTISVPSAVSQPIALPQAAVERETPAMARTAVAAQRTRTIDVTPAQLAFGLYLLVALGLLARDALRHVRFMRTVRRWQRPMLSRRALSVYARAAKEMGVRRAPRLMVCPAVTSPMLVGILSPRILLPQGFEAGGALDMVLRHELAHHRQRDLIIRAMSVAVRAMHWFNPMARLCVRMVENYCELACDERAMRGVDREARAAYGGVIVDCLRAGRFAGSPLTTGFSLDKRMLKKRLLDMMDMRGRKRGAWFMLIAAALCVVVGAGVVLAEQGEGTKPDAAKVVYQRASGILKTVQPGETMSAYAFSTNEAWEMTRIETDCAQEGYLCAEPTGDWYWYMGSVLELEAGDAGAVWLRLADGQRVVAAIENTVYTEDKIADNGFDGHLHIHFPDGNAAQQAIEDGWKETQELTAFASGWNEAPMTIEEWDKIYEEVTTRMNTVAHYRYDADFIKAYEADVKARGGELKEDMVICMLPGEKDMPYGAALEYAYALIGQTYGVDRATLQSMGAYPTFYEYPYMDVESEWEFYITPRRDCDIELDHEYPPEGEYRVTFTSRTGQVLLCVQYLPDGQATPAPMVSPTPAPTGVMNPPQDTTQSVLQSIVQTRDGQATPAPKETAGATPAPTATVTPMPMATLTPTPMPPAYVLDVTMMDALSIAREDFIAYKGIARETYDAAYVENVRVSGDTYALELLVREDAGEEWAGQNYAYGVSGETGEILYRQVSTCTLRALDESDILYDPAMGVFISVGEPVSDSSAQGDDVMLDWSVSSTKMDEVRKDGVAVYIAQASGAAQVEVKKVTWEAEDRLKIELSLSAPRNLFIVTPEITVNGFRLINPEQNDLENSWLHNPLEGEAGSRGATIRIRLTESAFDAQSDALTATLDSIRAGGAYEIGIAFSLLRQENGLRLVDTTELSAGEAWKRIDEAVDNGFTPIDSEPWFVLPASTWMEDGATSFIGEETPVMYPLGDKQVMIDHANMVEVDAIVLRVTGE